MALSAPLIDRARGVLLRGGLRILSATWRYVEEIPYDCREALAGGEPVVIVFWHGSMLPLWYRFRKLDVAALVSASRDGELLSGYLRSIGYRSIIRGSSSKGGSEALGAVVGELRTRSVALTPDGPRGPARRAKVGALIASIRSGRRILLVGCAPVRAMHASGWDRMSIPFPFTTIVIRYCITTPSTTNEQIQIDNNEIEELSKRLSSLDDIDHRYATRVGEHS
jgi:lysophospholipid acyltransferase (LPLAT)-like uncharacterized protein